jgi:methionyl-tRNA synthetase
MTPEDYADMMAAKHQAVWDGLGIEYTDFVRTRDPKHFEVVQAMLQRSYDAGDIYLGTYEGKYCVGCEEFKRDSDLNESGRCPLHPDREISILSEQNYFFRLSKYQDRLIELYASHPDFVLPEHRFREVIEFVKGGLEDFSISRAGSTFGIPLPFDPAHVTYVWYDALANYVTACQGDQARFWPANLQIVGKEILRFHAIYWPAMLWSAGFEIPRQLLAGGFITIDGQKISKSLGNVIDPVEFSAEYPRELMDLYLLHGFPIGSDGDFSTAQAIHSYNAHLANNVGNLLNRFLVLTLKRGNSLETAANDAGFLANRERMMADYRASMARYDLRGALESVFLFADTLNKYLDVKRPWESVADESRSAETADTLGHLGEGLYALALLLSPFFPAKMRELLSRIGHDESARRLAAGALPLESDIPFAGRFEVLEKGLPLFARVDVIK